jgi:hypothetical protein
MTTKKKPLMRGLPDEMGLEYRFDYKASRPNRFASRMRDAVVVVGPHPKPRSRKRGSKKEAG